MTPPAERSYEPRTGVRRARAAALTVAAVCALTGCTTKGGGAAPPDIAVPSVEVSGADLETLLLDDADIARLTAAPGLRTVEAYAQMPDPDGRTYSDAVCGGAISSASTTTYPGGDVTGVRGHRLNDGVDTAAARTRSVDQAVIAFPAASAAREFVAAARTGWASCAGAAVETRDTAAATLWRVGQPRYTDGVLSVTATHASGWVTEHAIAAAGGVVIDVSVTSADAGADRAGTIVRSIASRIAQ